MRRGACPGLSAPMPTGDGLLVRLLPIGTIPLAALAALCAAARTHGNGVIEITARGSIQIRGLTTASAPRFAAAIAALGIAAGEGVPIHCNPLSGLDPDEILDAGALAARLRHALAERAMAEKLSAKVSVAIDGDGSLALSTLSTDIRLRARASRDDVAFHVGVGGDEANAIDLGFVASDDGVEAAIRLLAVLAQRGRHARAREILATEGSSAFHDAVDDLLLSARPRESGDPGLDSRLRGNERLIASAEAIGQHRLRSNLFAFGIGLSFGHTDATSLERLIDAATACGADGLRTAPGRALLVIGLKKEMVPAFGDAAARLNFITRADDPRRHIVACAGAPICASAHIASRTLAPLVADRTKPYLGDDVTIHISGCAKGCARAAAATLTVVGTADGAALIAAGSTRDAPFAIVAADELPDAILRQMRARKNEIAHV